ncbi:stemmadenine O-acetyltransferase-like [Salvia miltiorrhiza]|uniref:stemmadenine O-acetyltransferase-like n=1 Tax=Salvia miltiorrhiza TaxID=226208 RepID=UPI0025ABBEB5|nr:stemmadenine O-acetyltransferase-like [Salvia miltiorrhiza]
MEREIKIISSANVKPSSPTPRNLRHYKFSMLDQIFPPTALALALYYPNTTQINDPDSFASQIMQQLTRSLSVILTRFYPLAGRASGEGEFIDCNDAGVPFTVARFSGHELSEHLADPRPDLLLPCGTDWGTDPGPDSAVALIQVNCFDCGGVAIGAVFWHKVVDASTVSAILRSWGAAARGSKEPVCPNYIAQYMFPQKEEMPVPLGSTTDIAKTGKSVVRRYIFDTSAISSLRSKLSSVKLPSRVEVVSALLWKCFMSASLVNGKSTSLLAQTLDLRRRAQPPFPPECFGNFLALAPATSTNDENAELGDLVKKMRDSITKIDDDYINRMRGDEGLMGYYENLRLMWTEYSQEVDILPISSVCGHGVYDIDFGWGKPVWSSRCETSNIDSEMGLVWNRIWLTDTRFGDGIEAWVILEDKYMSVFDQVEELRAIASVDPSPTLYLRSRF